MSGRAPLLWLVAGFGVWSLAFVALYGLQAVGCAAGWNRMLVGPTDLHRLVLVAVYLASLAAVGMVLVVQYRLRHPAPDPSTRFLHRAGFAATVASVFASVLVFAPVLGLSTC